MSKQVTQSSHDDSDKNIPLLTPREHVRLRPGMYIGGVDKRALHHMIWEVLDNSVEDALLGKCSEVKISLLENHAVRIEDNGEGLDVACPEGESRSFAELVMTDMWHKSSFDGNYYGVNGSLHGIGLFAANALSETCLLEIKREGFLWRQAYKEGIAISPLEKVRTLEEGERTGTSITFRPDFTILDENDFDYERICKRCDELACLVPQLKIFVEDRRDNQQAAEFYHPQGLMEYVFIQTKFESPVTGILATKVLETLTRSDGTEYQIGLDIAFQYIEVRTNVLYSFINLVRLPEGGSQEDALVESLVKLFTTDGVDAKTVAHTVTDGLIGAISIRHPDPYFESPTKTKLLNQDIKPIIEKAIEAIFAANPEAKAAIQGRFKGE